MNGWARVVRHCCEFLIMQIQIQNMETNELVVNKNWALRQEIKEENSEHTTRGHSCERGRSVSVNM